MDFELAACLSAYSINLYLFNFFPCYDYGCLSSIRVSGGGGLWLNLLWLFGFFVATRIIAFGHWFSFLKVQPALKKEFGVFSLRVLHRIRIFALLMVSKSNDGVPAFALKK
jgi:hypothetical protein